MIWSLINFVGDQEPKDGRTKGLFGIISFVELKSKEQKEGADLLIIYSSLLLGVVGVSRVEHTYEKHCEQDIDRSCKGEEKSRTSGVRRGSRMDGVRRLRAQVRQAKP